MKEYRSPLEKMFFHRKQWITVQVLAALFLLPGWGPGRTWAETPRVVMQLTGAPVQVRPDAGGRFSIRVTVPKKHHAYLDSGSEGFFIPLRFDFSGLTGGGYRVKTLAAPSGEKDEKVRATVLRGQGTYRFLSEATASRPQSKVFHVTLRSQICNDLTNICFPPQTTSLSLPVQFQGTGSSAPPVGALGGRSASLAPASGAKAVTNEEGEGATGWLLAKYHQYSKNIFISFLFMMMAGLLSAATPCVYPMLPITSAILMQRGGGSRQEGIRHSLVYFTGIILTYMILGYAAGMTGGALNIIMRSAVVNLLFAVLFALLGLAMMGFYNFAFAQDLTAQIDASASSRAGFAGTLLMGMAAGLVVSPCVGPIVFALLLHVANHMAEMNAAVLASGGTLSLVEKSVTAGRGGILMGGFGIGIGIPFLLVGLFSNRMPRAGTWMNLVKYLLGAVILYFAFVYFMKGMGVAGVRPDVAHAILLGAASIFASVYIGLFKPWEADDSPNEKLKKALAIILLVFGIHFFFHGLDQSGLLLESSRHAEATRAEDPRQKTAEKLGNLTWQRDFGTARTRAQREDKPIFIDFYADWCANCIAFKKLSLSNKPLNQALQGAVLVKIYDTDPIFKEFQQDPRYAELKTGLPFFLILRPNGNFFWKGTQYNAVKTMRRMIASASQKKI